MSDVSPVLMVVRVAVAAPLDNLFDYRVPHALAGRPLAPGMRVCVPFGAAIRWGVVVELAPINAPDDGVLRDVLDLPDSEPALGVDDLRLGRWLSQYYHAPLGEVLSIMLPAALRAGGVLGESRPKGWRLTDTAPVEIPRAARQSAVLAALRAAGGCLTDEQLRGQGQILRSLASRAWITRCPLSPDDTQAPIPEDCGVALNAGQQEAYQAIRSSLGGFAAWLLHGVTGSGKTEVYLSVAADVLLAGRQVLVLVPEIALTPQLVARFATRLGGGLVTFHSGMTDTARREAWLAARAGQARVVLGTRSAVFVPMPKLGLVVVDEEHDGSYKQQDGMRYHARDTAVVRASQVGVPVILGSATPSLESLSNVAGGRYQCQRLDQRAGRARLPRLELLDVRRRPMDDGLSAPLVERMREHLLAGGQVLLFLNRRGYAAALTCHACGAVEHCRQCSAPMTVHRARGRLVCHHCGAERGLPRSCASCGESDFHMSGQGTERLEQALQGLFPEFPLERIDRDTTRRKGSLEAKLERARAGSARILLGTQMLAKGHDFPGVTLAVVLDADRGLFSNDFRAPERLVQLIVQVAGRAGRAERPGEVLIQTHHPDHPLLQALLRGGFDACAAELMHERRQACLPPFSHLALLRAESRTAERGRALLRCCARRLSEAGHEVAAWGPAPAPLERRAGRFRDQLLLSARRREALHGALSDLLSVAREWPESKGVRWSVDVDPQDLG
ncbi:MAG: primosomal protein N' [Pseudomonadota bacterium]